MNNRVEKIATAFRWILYGKRGILYYATIVFISYGIGKIMIHHTAIQIT